MCMKVVEDVDRLDFLGLLATGSGLRVDVYNRKRGPLSTQFTLVVFWPIDKLVQIG